MLPQANISPVHIEKLKKMFKQQETIEPVKPSDISPNTPKPDEARLS
jgi:hypothetical protein